MHNNRLETVCVAQHLEPGDTGHLERGPPKATVDSVHVLSVLGVPMLTRPQQLGIKAWTVAVSAGCFKKKGVEACSDWARSVKEQ